MKTLLIKIEGDIEPGDIVIFQCRHRYHGGQTNARGDVFHPRHQMQEVDGEMVVITQKDTMRDLVDRIVREVNAHWGSDFSAKRRGDQEREFVVQCMGGQDLEFFSSIQGNEKMVIEELA